MNEKMEVERCVMEMVSWVSESLQNQQYNQQLKKTLRKVKRANRPGSGARSKNGDGAADDGNLSARSRRNSVREENKME